MRDKHGQNQGHPLIWDECETRQWAGFHLVIGQPCTVQGIFPMLLRIYSRVVGVKPLQASMIRSYTMRNNPAIASLDHTMRL